MDNIHYKYREDELIKELQEYVDTTYSSEDNAHYAQGEIECTEYNIDQGHGDGFIAGNINKYNNRYGKKDGKNRKDLMKVLHYALMRLYLHDEEEYSVTFDFGDANLSFTLEEQNGESKEESRREPDGFSDSKSYFSARTVKGFGKADN